MSAPVFTDPPRQASRRSRGLLRELTLGRLAMALTFVVVVVIALRPPLDVDTYWHLRSGEWEVAHRAVLREDVFSFTQAGEPWIDHSWLSQIILYGAYAAVGDVGLALFTAVFGTVGMALIYRQMRADPLVRALVMVLGASAAAVFWSARPQMVSFLGCAIVLTLLREKWRGGPDWLWLIPPLMLFWANLHGGFALGFVLLALAMAGELIHWLIGDESETAPPPARTLEGVRPLFKLGAVGLASAVAVCANPFGPRLLLLPFQTVGVGLLHAFIQEWATPNFHDRRFWPFLALLLALIVTLARSRRRLDWRELALLIGTGCLALIAARNIPIFVLVAAPLLADALAELLVDRGVHFQLDRRPQGVLAFAHAAFLALLVVAGVAYAGSELGQDALAEAREAILPVEAVAVLQQEAPPGRLFNSYSWGGYILWVARDYPVIVDGRTDLYGDAILEPYMDVYLGHPGWADALDESQINTVLIERGSPLAALVESSADWSTLYVDNVAGLYVRREPLADG